MIKAAILSVEDDHMGYLVQHPLDCIGGSRWGASACQQWNDSGGGESQPRYQPMKIHFISLRNLGCLRLAATTW